MADILERRTSSISGEDAREIEAQIAGIVDRKHIVLNAYTGKPVKKEQVFLVAVNVLLFGAAAAVLFFSARHFSVDSGRVTDPSAFTSVEGALIQQLRSASSEVISEKDAEIASIRRQLRVLEEQRRQSLNDFDASLTDREAAFLASLRTELEAEQARLIEGGMSPSDADARIQEIERERLAAYRRQIADERDAIQRNFDEMESRHKGSLRVLNDERQAVQTASRRQEESMLSLPVALNDSETLEQARQDLRRLNESRQRLADEDAVIANMLMGIQNDVNAGRFEDAARNADSLAVRLRDMPESDRRRADISLAETLSVLARVEIADEAPVAAVVDESLLDAANARIAELETALSESVQKADDAEANARTDAAASAESAAALAAAARRSEVLETQIAALVNERDNRARAVAESLTEAKNRADEGDAAGALAAYRQAGERIGLFEDENGAFIAGVESYAALAGSAFAVPTEQSNAVLREQSARLLAENERLQESERSLNQHLLEATAAYNAAKPNADAYLALVRTYGVYRRDPDGLSELERFLNSRELEATFPGFTEKMRSITDNLRLAARTEALDAASSIFETAVRIQTPSTRKLYLEGIKARYAGEPNMTTFIELLLQRL